MAITYSANGDTLVWTNEDLEGCETVNLNGELLYRISDAIVTLDDLKNGFSSFMTIDGEESRYENSYEGCLDLYSDLGVILLNEGVIAIEHENQIAFGVEFPKPGIYAMRMSDGVETGFTIPGYTGFKESESSEPEFNFNKNWLHDLFIEEVEGSLNRGGGGNGGDSGDTVSIQSDWSQNDETAADYVKNRTHYEEIKWEESYVRTGSVPISARLEVDGVTIMVGNPRQMPNISSALSLEVGSIYRITMDSFIFEGVVREISDTTIVKGSLYLGNAYLIGFLKYHDTLSHDEIVALGYVDTGEDFIYYATEFDSISQEFISYLQDVTSNYVQSGLVIEKGISTIHPLDKKYIPDLVALKSDIPTMDAIYEEMVSRFPLAEGGSF